MFVKAIPILPVNEMQAAISFYENRLGFTGFNKGNWGVVKRGIVELHLMLVAAKPPFKSNCCRIYINNIEDYYAELSAKELISPDGRLQRKFGDITEFFIDDNNGNTLYFRKIN